MDVTKKSDGQFLKIGLMQNERTIQNEKYKFL